MAKEKHCQDFLLPQMNANSISQPTGAAQGPAGGTTPTGGATQGRAPFFFFFSVNKTHHICCPILPKSS